MSSTDSIHGTCYIFDVQPKPLQEETCPGRLVFPISPQTVMLGVKVVYSIDKSFVHDLSVSLDTHEAATVVAH